MSLTIFLVKGTISITPYMGNSHEFTCTKIVYATDKFEASDKFEEHFRKKSDPYGGSVYYAHSISVESPIL